MDEEINLVKTLEEKITSNTSAFVFSALTLGIGIKREWQKITKLCRDSGVKTIMDISYLVGHENLAFENFMPDIVTSSSSNGALGPHGIAFQVTSETMNDKLDPLFVGGGSVISLNKENYKLSNWSNKFETGSINIAAVLGLANSLEFLSNIGFNVIQSHESKMRSMLVDGLRKIEEIEIIDLKNTNKGPILSFRSETIDSHDIAIILEDLGNIIVRSGALCSHLFMDEINQNSLVQLSTHIYNTDQQISTFLETMKSIIEEI